MKPVKVCVIGTGVMGKNHVRAYVEMEEAELVGIADKDEEALEEFKRKYKVPIYTDYMEMLEKERPEAVTIAVPTILHKQVALDVIEKGIHLLIEKPIAATITEAEEIIAAAKKKGVKLMIGHIERFNPAVRELKRRIQKGELGHIYKIDVNRVGPFPPRIQDVGVVIDLAVHDIDIVRYLLEADPQSIFAETERRIHSKKEDLLASILRFDNKTICYFNINWLTATKIRKLYITGEKGLFVIDYLQQHLYLYENPPEPKEGVNKYVREGRMIRFKIDKKEPLKNELAAFLKSVRDDTEPPVTGEDGKKVLEIAHTILTSAKEKKRMER